MHYGTKSIGGVAMNLVISELVVGEN